MFLVGIIIIYLWSVNYSDYQCKLTLQMLLFMITWKDKNTHIDVDDSFIENRDNDISGVQVCNIIYNVRDYLALWNGDIYVCNNIYFWSV